MSGFQIQDALFHLYLCIYIDTSNPKTRLARGYTFCASWSKRCPCCWTARRHIRRLPARSPDFRESGWLGSRRTPRSVRVGLPPHHLLLEERQSKQVQRYQWSILFFKRNQHKTRKARYSDYSVYTVCHYYNWVGYNVFHFRKRTITIINCRLL